MCDAAGRTCDSAFGNFTLHAEPPAGCTPFGSLSGIPATFGLFDAGVGPVTVGSNTAAGTRAARPSSPAGSWARRARSS